MKIKGSKYASYKGAKWSGNSITIQRAASRRLRLKKSKFPENFFKD